MPLPLILAGPILRRVEPTLVSVWVALSEASQVQLTLWDGLVADDGRGEKNQGKTGVFFHTETPPIRPAAGQPLLDTSKTIRIGDQLHITVVMYKLPEANALIPNRPYSYNITIAKQANNTTEDLNSLHLLENDPIENKPNLALGYEPGFLPSFELSPMELTDLRVLHGSCRRLNRKMEDGLAWVDDMIREARQGLPDPLDATKTLKRPHQLLLTGDQIYADDVPIPLLPQLIKKGRELLGDNEFLPTRWPKETQATYWPADATHFPPGLRQQLITTEARFTTVDTNSHLISFGEFAAMYIFVWSNTLWDVSALTPFDETIAGITTLPENMGALFKRSKEKKEDEIKDDELKEFAKQLFEIVPKDELRRALRSQDKLGTNPDQKPLNPSVLELERMNKLTLAQQQEFISIYTYALRLLPEKLERFKDFFAGIQEDFQSPTELYETERSLKARKLEVEMFHKSLPKVRRALANVPTYMIFDDHEITDDWNLNPMWKDRVYTSPLGRTILRNGLLAYALFQGWGNDPEKFQTGKEAELLQLATELYPHGSNVPPQTEPEVANKINLLFALDDNENPPIKWHYSVKGAKHLVFVLDNRTRRSFVSRVGPPGNVALKALEEQIPAGLLPSGMEVVFVVASLPVIGPPLFDEVIAPLSYRVYDLISYAQHGNERLKNMPGTNPDAIEAWAFDPKTFEALLKRLEPYRRVIFLSGDVHYGSSQFLSYWKKDDEEPARFIQFISSGLRNVMPEFIRLADRSFPLAQRIIRAKIGITRLGWDTNSPPPLALPADQENIPPIFRAKLRKSPVMIPATGWPAGTSQTRPPDWAWRAHVLLDERKDSERPEPSRPDPLPANTNARTVEGHRQVAARHAKQFTKMKHGRQILFANNLGVVRFEVKQTKDGGILEAIQELYSAHPEAPDPEKAELYTLHRAPLAALNDGKLNEAKPKIGVPE